MKSKNSFLLVLLLVSWFCATGQTKMEFEKRIDRSEFPEAALNWLEAHPEVPGEVRYYLEQDGEQTTYEVKFKTSGNSFSIEFDQAGELLDVEIITRLRKIEEPRQGRIKAFLDQEYKKWKLDRLQRQYTVADNGKQVLERIFKNDDSLIENLEMELATRENGETRHYELTFDPQGELIRKRVIEGLTYDYKKF